MNKIRFDCKGSTLLKSLVVSFIVAKLLRKFQLWYNAASIRGSVCVVTGASQGIGAALAHQLVAHGAKKVILVARTEQKLIEVAESIHSLFNCTDKAIVRAVDCSNYEQVEELAKFVKNEYGVPDIIVNCSGAGKWRYLFEMSPEEIVQCMDAPYFAAAFICKAFLPDLIQKNVGCIVNVQSPAGHTSWGGSTAYMAGRWALRGLCEALRADLSSTKIKVQEVILGEVQSEYFNANPGSIERIPKIGRLAPPLSTERAAKGIISAIRSGKSVYTFPCMLDLLMTLNSWFPSVVSTLTTKTGWKLHHSTTEENNGKN